MAFSGTAKTGGVAALPADAELSSFLFMRRLRLFATGFSDGTLLITSRDTCPQQRHHTLRPTHTSAERPPLGDVAVLSSSGFLDTSIHCHLSLSLSASAALRWRSFSCSTTHVLLSLFRPHLRPTPAAPLAYRYCQRAVLGPSRTPLDWGLRRGCLALRGHRACPQSYSNLPGLFARRGTGAIFKRSSFPPPSPLTRPPPLPSHPFSSPSPPHPGSVVRDLVHDSLSRHAHRGARHVIGPALVGNPASSRARRRSCYSWQNVGYCLSGGAGASLQVAPTVSFASFRRPFGSLTSCEATRTVSPCRPTSLHPPRCCMLLHAD